MNALERPGVTQTWYASDQLDAVTRGARLDQRAHQLRIVSNSLYFVLALATAGTVLGLVKAVPGVITILIALAGCLVIRLALQRIARLRIQLTRTLSSAA